MTIKAYSYLPKIERQEIMIGNWVCPESMMRDGIAGQGGKVSKVTASMVTYQDKYGHAVVKAKKNIAFVCDSEKEMLRCAEESNLLWRGLAKHAEDRKRGAIEKLVRSKDD